MLLQYSCSIVECNARYIQRGMCFAHFDNIFISNPPSGCWVYLLSVGRDQSSVISSYRWRQLCPGEISIMLFAFPKFSGDPDYLSIFSLPPSLFRPPYSLFVLSISTSFQSALAEGNVVTLQSRSSRECLRIVDGGEVDGKGERDLQGTHISVYICYCIFFAYLKIWSVNFFFCIFYFCRLISPQVIIPH